MSKLAKITEILSTGKMAAFMYAGGSQPNRVRIVNGADGDCLNDVEDNTPKHFKEEKISNVFVADDLLVELNDMVQKGSRFVAACLKHYNEHHTTELKLEGGELKVANKLYVRDLSGDWRTGLEFGLGDKRLDLYIGDKNEVCIELNGKKVKSDFAEDLIKAFEEFADG